MVLWEGVTGVGSSIQKESEREKESCWVLLIKLLQNYNRYHYERHQSYHYLRSVTASHLAIAAQVKAEENQLAPSTANGGGAAGSNATPNGNSTSATNSIAANAEERKRNIKKSALRDELNPTPER